jgi:hypothetical protein
MRQGPPLISCNLSNFSADFEKKKRKPYVIKYCGIFAQSKNCGGSETAVAR